MRDEIEKRLGSRRSTLRPSEIIGPGVASEHLETGRLYPLKTTSIRRSSIRKSGAVLPEGKDGEVVITSLTKVGCRWSAFARADPHAAPARQPGAPCAGWRASRRSDDMLIIRGVNCIPPQIENLLKNDRLSPHYVLEVRRDGHWTIRCAVERRSRCRRRPKRRSSGTSSGSSREPSREHQGARRRPGHGAASQGKGGPRHRQAAKN